MAMPTTLLTHSKESSRTWGRSFTAQVERCWKRPATDRRKSIEAVFEIKLKRDGTLEGAVVVSTVATTPDEKAYQASASRAITACQPYQLPDADYDEWRHFEPVFRDR